MIAAETCAACRFFSFGTTKAFPEVDGMCRRYAPSGAVIGCHSAGFQVFPPMMAHQWCGDFRPDPARVSSARAAA